MNRNNWRIFHDLGSNKMVFMPHGLDQMFGVDRTTPECSILPPMQGMVARAVLGTAEGRRRYLERMSQLYTSVFHVGAILRRVDELSAVIHPVIAASDSQAARRQEQAVQGLKSRITRRDESLRQQFAALATRPAFDTNGVMRLSGWRPKTQSGTAAHRQEEGPGGVPLLYVTAASGNTIASWRTRVLLDPGSYRFEGRVRTRDVRPGSGEAGAGAGLRISGGTVASGLTGTTDWRRVVYPVRVTEGGADVEFVCELRASRGEVWFDTSSLMAVRLR
jgi:hypothetical protein